MARVVDYVISGQLSLRNQSHEALCWEFLRWPSDGVVVDVASRVEAPREG